MSSSPSLSSLFLSLSLPFELLQVAAAGGWALSGWSGGGGKGMGPEWWRCFGLELARMDAAPEEAVA
jgi:hypothetical protein